MATRVYQRAWNGGEVSVAVSAQVGDAARAVGAALLHNLVVLPQGPVVRRPGSLLVAETAGSAPCRLLGFRFSVDDTAVIRLAAGGARFAVAGAPVLHAAAPAYKPQKSFAPGDVDTGTERITFASAHGFDLDEPIEFTSTGARPVGINGPSGTIYYARPVSPTVLEVAAAPGGAAIDITTQGTGVHALHRAYRAMDLATFGGVAYYCRQRAVLTGASVVPGTNLAYWHPQPASGEYEVPLPYLEAELFAIGWVQSNDVVTLVHPNHQPLELRRYANNRWDVQLVTFGPTLPAPTGVAVAETNGELTAITSIEAQTAGFSYFKCNGADSIPHGALRGDTVVISGLAAEGVPDGQYIVAAATGPSNQLGQFSLKTLAGAPVAVAADASVAGTARVVSLNADETNEYVVTAMDDDELESPQSSVVTATLNSLLVAGASNLVTWAAVTGATRYRVYRKRNGLFGLLGETEALQWKDDGSIAPDLGRTPPIQDTTLAAPNWPEAVAYLDQRRVFARGQRVWMTRTGTESDLSYRLPLVDTDRIQFDVSARENSSIRHMLALGHLLLLTESTEYRVMPGSGAAITPTSRQVRAESYVGCGRAAPLLAGHSPLFAAARGGHVMQLGYSQERDGLVPGDLSMRAAHLFDGLSIVDSAFQKAPHPIAWFVSSNGKLLGLTYAPEEQVFAWHQHSTAGAFESVAVVPEGDEDRIYVVVRRTIGGVTKRFVERLAPLDWGTLPAAVFVDCGKTLASDATGLVTGLVHLAGEMVSILADGIVQPPQKVTAAGTIKLAKRAQVVQVGLGYTSELLTLPLAAQIEGYGQGRQKAVTRVWLRVQDAARFEVATAVGGLYVPAAGFASLEQLRSEEVEVQPHGHWNERATVAVRQVHPLPLQILNLTIEASFGG